MSRAPIQGRATTTTTYGRYAVVFTDRQNSARPRRRRGRARGLNGRQRIIDTVVALRDDPFVTSPPNPLLHPRRRILLALPLTPLSRNIRHASRTTIINHRCRRAFSPIFLRLPSLHDVGSLLASTFYSDSFGRGETMRRNARTYRLPKLSRSH